METPALDADDMAQLDDPLLPAWIYIKRDDGTDVVKYANMQVSIYKAP